MKTTEYRAEFPLCCIAIDFIRTLVIPIGLWLVALGIGPGMTLAVGQEGWVASGGTLAKPSRSSPTDERLADAVPAAPFATRAGDPPVVLPLSNTASPLLSRGVSALPVSSAVELPPAPSPIPNGLLTRDSVPTLPAPLSPQGIPMPLTTHVVPQQPVAQTVYVPGEGLTVSMLDGSSELKLFGQFSTIGIFSTNRVFAAGLPLVVLPPSPSGLNTNTFDLHARQTAFGASFRGPDVLGFTPSATFLGFIQNDNLTSDAYGFLPFQAYGELKNDAWRIAAGLQSDVFNPGKPTIISLASLFGSGNVGSFRGQFRVERFLRPASDRQVTLQIALSEPVSTIVTNNTRILEDNGWPNVEGRVGLGLGEKESYAGSRTRRRVEAGVSGVVGQLRTSRLITAPTDPDVPNRVTIDTWGLGVDLGVAVTDRLGFAGELFMGQGLGEYNGGVLQSFNTAKFNPIRSKGGWGEVYYYVTDALHVHSGYGIDAPERGDLGVAQFAKNQTYFTNVVWDASKTVQLSFEVDYRETNYVGLEDANAVLFLSQFLLRF